MEKKISITYNDSDYGMEVELPEAPLSELVMVLTSLISSVIASEVNIDSDEMFNDVSEYITNYLLDLAKRRLMKE